MEATTKLHSYNFLDVRTYLFAALFVAGNIIMPQICHLVPRGGLIFLPIYFFTLVGAYKYGLSVGLFTAVLSPLVNHALFGMPAAGMLPSIIIKSVLLATFATVVAQRCGRVSLAAIIIVVLAYQIIGSAAEWLMGASFIDSIQDFRLGIPGMLLQMFGGYAVIRCLSRR